MCLGYLRELTFVSCYHSLSSPHGRHKSSLVCGTDHTWCVYVRDCVCMEQHVLFVYNSSWRIMRSMDKQLTVASRGKVLPKYPPNKKEWLLLFTVLVNARYIHSRHNISCIFSLSNLGGGCKSSMDIKGHEIYLLLEFPPNERFPQYLSSVIHKDFLMNKE